MGSKRKALVLLLAGTLFVSAIMSLFLYYPKDMESTVPQLTEDFENEIDQAEAKLKVPSDRKKRVLWAFPDHRSTEYGLVYLHGWSATQRELSPTLESLALQLESNLFFTRFSGHGLGRDGFLNLNVQSFLEDSEEALAVAQKLGRKVILVGMSTGAALSLYLSKKYPDRVAGLILISPNFRPSNPLSVFLIGPLGPLVSRLVFGEDYHFAPKNPEQEQFWTTRYPSRALSVMMRLLSSLDSIELESIKTPTLVIFTEKDQDVSVDLIKRNFERIGSPIKKISAIPAEDHVLAGDIMSPKTTEMVVTEIKDFISLRIREAIPQ